MAGCVLFDGRLRRTLFGDQEVRTKEADFGKIGRYFVERLKTIFTAVANNPLPLRNSRNVPLYLLCFAAGNPRGASTALKIAQNILKSRNNGRALTYRVDRSDVESGYRLHEDQSGLQELLCRATRTSLEGDGQFSDIAMALSSRCTKTWLNCQSAGASRDLFL